MKKLNIKINLNFLYFFVLLKLFLTSLNPAYSEQLLREEISSNKNKETLISKNNDVLLNKKRTYYSQSHNLFIFFQYFENFVANLPENVNSINIISDTQSRNENEFKAEGNVIINFEGKQIKSDILTYNKEAKILTLKGNIFFKKGSQYFEAKEIYYNVKDESGYIENIYGQIDSKTFKDDIGIDMNTKDSESLETDISNLNILDEASFGVTKELETYKDFNFRIPEIVKWRFKSKKIYIKPNFLKSDEIFFTNDAFNEPQFFIESYNFEGEYNDEKVKFKSKNTWINLDDRLKFPIGNSSFFDGQDSFNRWGFGYDNEDKDGLFIRRGSDAKKIFGNYNLKINSYFLLQRAIEGDTNSFDRQGKSLAGNELIYQNNLTDLFAIDTKLDGKIGTWNLDFKSSNNSLDPNKLSESSRIKLNIEKSIKLKSNNSLGKKSLSKNSFLNIKFSSSYREKILKGFDGEEEIYWGNSFSLVNPNYREYKNQNINYSLLYEFGQFNAKSSDKEELDSLIRNIFVSELNQEIFLWRKKGLEETLNNQYKYSPQIISQGLTWKNTLKSGLFLYSNDTSQKLISLSTGPELTLGRLKSKLFDYTKLGAEATYIFKDGKSPFAFDDVNDSFRIRFNLEQQLYGAIGFNSETYLNLDNEDKDYGYFVESTFGLELKRRAYKIGVFYKPTAKSVGIKFNIFNFDYTGFAPSFKK